MNTELLAVIEQARVALSGELAVRQDTLEELDAAYAAAKTRREQERRTVQMLNHQIDLLKLLADQIREPETGEVPL